MRKITKEAVDKFLSRETFKKSNMEVDQGYGQFRLKLHGNVIATLDELGVLTVSNAGWATNTTKRKIEWYPWRKSSPKELELVLEWCGVGW